MRGGQVSIIEAAVGRVRADWGPLEPEVPEAEAASAQPGAPELGPPEPEAASAQPGQEQPEAPEEALAKPGSAPWVPVVGAREQGRTVPQPLVLSPGPVAPGSSELLGQPELGQPAPSREPWPDWFPRGALSALPSEPLVCSAPASLEQAATPELAGVCE